ncbi:MAG TPA: MupA/Atu3671 family FMN-dependent luciferase-like monooxygenase [Micromonosporaceae bacterium]
MVEVFPARTPRTDESSGTDPDRETGQGHPDRGGDLDTTGDEIAIIGMAGRFPGAPNLRRFWNNLREGKESISIFNERELETSAMVPQRLHQHPDFVPAGGVLTDAERFDHRFFGMSRREASWTDPQQRVFLEVAWNALEDAGYDPYRFADRISVYAGAGTSGHSLRLLGDLAGDPASLYEALGSATPEHLATKVAFALGLRGEAVTVQTACSTGLASVHLACQSLLMAQSAMAIAGAVRVALPQHTGYLYQDGMILSSDGHCRPFDHRAGGTVSGNGVGVVVLRPLRDALAAGDHIYAVIKGSAINNDGHRGIGYTAPSVAGQAEVISEALAVAGVSGGDIGYVEAHGTGTRLGDPIEIAALTRAYRPGTDRTGYCRIGSLKSNIGHLDTAAGVAGLIKVALMLQHGEVPPSLHFQAPNPAIDFAPSPFRVATELRPWQADGTPRLAGVSSFGIGGTNVHAVVQEAPVLPPRPADPDGGRPHHLVTVSARTASAAAAMAAELADHVERAPEINLADLAYTRAVGRAEFDHRRSYVVAEPGELVAALRKPERPQPSAADRPRVAWLFPGQGAAWHGMAADLYRAEPAFREELDRCLAELEPRLGRSLLPVLLAGTGPIEEPELAHPALFAMEYALGRLWLAWGVRPDALLGHSFGEYAAACLAGVLGLSDAAELTVARGRLVSGMPQGAMLAVALDPPQLDRYLGPELSLAAVNGDQRCVVSGSPEDVAKLADQLATDGIASVSLPVRHAFHSKAVEPLLPELRAVAEHCPPGPPSLPLLSSLTGTWWEDEDGSPDYWARQMRQPVRFATALRSLHDDVDVDPASLVLLEVGPDQTLTMLARAQLRDRARVVPSLGRHGGSGSDHRMLLDAAGRLWRAGVPVDWESFHRDQPARRISLPGYPFEGVDCSLPTTEPVERARPRRADPDTADATPTSSPEHPPAEPAESEPAGVSDAPIPATPPSDSGDGPRDEVERTVFGIWRERLGTDEFGIHDHFLELGGNSLMAAQMLTRLRDAFPVAIPLNALFEAPTVAGLAERIRAMLDGEPQSGSDTDRLPPIRPVPRDGAVPLSVVQQRALAMEAADPDNPALLMPVAVLLEGRLDLDALRAGLGEVIRRHETLRTTFHLDGRSWTARVQERVTIALDVEELDGPPEIRQERAQELAREEAGRGVELSRSALRIRLLRLAEDRHVLLVTLHHVVSDTWSLVTLLQELTAGYQAHLAGEPAAPPALGVQYADFAAWQRQLISTGALNRQREYWRQRMAQRTPLALPSDQPRTRERGMRGVRTQVRIPGDLSQRLRDLSQHLGVTPFVTLLAGYTALLGRVAGTDDVVVGTPVGNRDRAELEPLIGYVAHALPLRTDLAGDPSFSELVGRVQQVLLSAYQNPDLPYEHLVAELDPDRAAPAADARSRLFDAVFVLHSGIVAEQNTAGVTWRLWEVSDLPSQFGATLSALTLMLADGPEGLSGVLEYAAELFEPRTAQRLIDQFQTLLHDAARRPEARLSELDLGGPPATPALPTERATDTSASDPLVLDPGTEPDQPAVLEPDAVTTWAELAAEAERVASRLRKRVPAIGTVVVPELPYSARWLAAVLGAVRAGYPVVLPGTAGLPAVGDPLPAQGLAITIWRLIEGGSGHHTIDLLEDIPDSTTSQGHQHHTTPGDPERAVFVEPAPSGSDGGGTAGWRTWSGVDVAGYLTSLDLTVGTEIGAGGLVVTESPSNVRAALDLLWALTRGRPVRLAATPRQATARWVPAHRRNPRGLRFSLSYFANDEAGVSGPKYRLLLEGARLADRLGFAAIWTPERHFHSFGGLYPSPAVVSAGMATITERLGIRAGSVVLPLHDPIQVAEEWAVIDNLSGGRVGVSFASGWHADDFVFAPDHYDERKQVMLESIDLVRRLWRGEPVRRRGGTGELVDVAIRPRPVQAELPFWLTAAGSPATFQLAGELGGYVLTNLMGQTLDDLADKIARYRRAWREAGHGPDQGHVTLMLHTFLAEREAEAYAVAEAPLLRYFRSSVDIVRGFTASQGIDVRPEDLSEADLDALLRHGLERYLHDGGLFGTPDSCTAMVDRVRELGVDEVAALIDFGVPVDAALRGVELLGQVLEQEQARARAASEVTARQTDAVVSALATRLREPGVAGVLATPDLAAWLAELNPDALAGRAVLVATEPGEPADRSPREILDRLVNTGARTMVRHTVNGWPRIAAWARYGPVPDELTIRPDPDAGVRVLDESGRELGVGVVGGLAIGGSPVTRQRARWRADGMLELLPPAPKRAPVATPELASPVSDAPEVIRPVDRDGPLPLSYSQQRLWSLDHLSPQNIAYNNPVALRMRGPLDVSALHRALQEVVRRHEVLRSTFPATQQGAVQVIHSSLTVDLPVVEVVGDTPDAVAGEVNRLAREHARRPFDLATGPLLGACLLRLPATGDARDAGQPPVEHVLLISMHHIVSDGWSAGVLLGELAALYVAFQTGRPSPLPPLPIQFADYAVWQRRQGDSPRIRQELEYWKQALADVPALRLPTDRPRGSVQSHDGARHPVRFDRQLTEALRGLSRACGVTPFMVLLAGFVTLLHRYSGQTDLAIGTAVAGRNRPETETLVGCFVNSVVVRTDATGDPTFRALLDRVRDTSLGAFAHQEIPFERLVDELRVPRDLSLSPLFQAMLILHNTPNPRVDLGGLSLEALEVDPGTAKLDLLLELREDDDGIGGALEYNTALFDVDTVEQLTRHLLRLLDDAVHHPDRRLSELTLLSDAERQDVLRLSEGSPLIVPGGLPGYETVSAAFEAQVTRTPDTVAVGDALDPVTYRELEVRANRLAHGLRQHGVRPGTQVGLLLDRPVDAITAMLAVLKAGGTYVPLDLAAPPGRQESVVSLADPVLILADAARPTGLAGVPVLAPRQVAADQPTTPPPPLAGPADPAYVIFTSGSTGRPKGVVVEHRNLLYTTWARYAYHGEPAGRCLTLFPLWFDGSVVWLYYALLTGGTIWCPEPDPERLAELVHRNAVERFSSVPALYAQLLAATEPAKLNSLRTVCLAGERLPTELARAHFQALPETTLQNDYGPTEITVFCTAYQLDGPPDAEVPIGQPLAEARCLVLDERGQLLPVGAPGELYVGGPGVARGYLGQPELTDQRFLPDRVTGSGRLYRTGDLTRWNHQGLLEYLGRIDRQVKIRGFRVEPGEVEAAITSHPDVAEAAVVPVAGRTTRLAGYLAPRPGADPDLGKLREFLQERLPDYLVPSHLVAVPSLPRTRNGKVNLTALPAPEDTTEVPAVPPRTELERTLAGIVAEVLDRPDVGIHDGFFDLGGDSILAITVVIRARSHGIDLDVQRLFQNPTIAQMAAASTVAEVPGGSSG